MTPGETNGLTLVLHKIICVWIWDLRPCTRIVCGSPFSDDGRRVASAHPARTCEWTTLSWKTRRAAPRRAAKTGGGRPARAWPLLLLEVSVLLLVVSLLLLVSSLLILLYYYIIILLYYHFVLRRGWRETRPCADGRPPGMPPAARAIMIISIIYIYIYIYIWV